MRFAISNADELAGIFWLSDGGVDPLAVLAAFGLDNLDVALFTEDGKQAPPHQPPTPQTHRLPNESEWKSSFG